MKVVRACLKKQKFFKRMQGFCMLNRMIYKRSSFTLNF